jgi:hypothetical protein
VNWGGSNTLLGMNYHPISKVVGWDVSNNFGAKFEWNLDFITDSSNFSNLVNYNGLGINQD